MVSLQMSKKWQILISGSPRNARWSFFPRIYELTNLCFCTAAVLPTWLLATAIVSRRNIQNWKTHSRQLSPPARVTNSKSLRKNLSFGVLKTSLFDTCKYKQGHGKLQCKMTEMALFRRKWQVIFAIFSLNSKL